MKYNNLRKIEYIISILLFFVFGFNMLFVYATEKSDLTEEQNNIDKQIKETNSEISGVKSQMTTALNQISKYNSQISTYEDEIDELETQIKGLEVQISEKESNIEEQTKKYEEQQNLLDKRLIAMYELGTTSYLDMLLSSDGLADFISKYYVISQLAEYDTELLKQIEETKNKIEDEKSKLENSKIQIENSKQQSEIKRNSLTVLVNEKNALVGTLSDEEKALQAKLEEYEQDKKEIQRKLAAIAAKEAAARGELKISEPSNAGFICPLSGKTRSNITTGYHGYAGHTGVDFACPSGTPIMAAKSGKVVISTALRNSSGGYRSYGEYIAISHGDGTMTLYAHMSRRAVSENDEVAQGQVIGYVGSTGNSTGPHLHFEVWIGGKRTNPTPYLP